VLSKGSLKARVLFHFRVQCSGPQYGDRLTGPRALVVTLRVLRAPVHSFATRLGSPAASCRPSGALPPPTRA
jgi:hypothetical protein